MKCSCQFVYFERLGMVMPTSSVDHATSVTSSSAPAPVQACPRPPPHALLRHRMPPTPIRSHTSDQHRQQPQPAACQSTMPTMT